MNKNFLKVVLWIGIGLLPFSAAAQSYPFKNPELKTADRINDLIGRLTLAEKASLYAHGMTTYARINN